MPAADAMVLRLAPADAPRREDGRRQRADSAAAASPAAPAVAPAAAPPSRPRPAPRPAPAPKVPAGAAEIAAAAQAPESPAAPSAPATPAGQPAPDATADAPPLVQMPSRYRVRMPEPVLLTYTQTRQSAGGAPEALPDARIDWRSDGERYALNMDGVLGRLSSRGGSGDAGVRPRSAAEDDGGGGGGGGKVTEFENGEVRFRASGRSVPDSVGIQDRASLLMQLAGIGLGEPEQLRGTVEVVVAGAADAVIERFEMAGVELLPTALGPIEAWHLAQPVVPGRARLEVWLAPARGWLPVQLRLTGADGVAATQTVSAITPQPNAVPEP